MERGMISSYGDVRLWWSYGFYNNGAKCFVIIRSLETCVVVNVCMLACFALIGRF